MKRTTFGLISIVIWTTLTLPQPLSTAAVAEIPTVPGKTVNIASPTAQPDSTLMSPTFADAVNQWVKRISGEQGYESWRLASWTSQPLGPGTHGWIVVLQKEGQTVGYMVIHAADPNNSTAYRLSEYGSGNKPLFSMQTLYRSLVQLELIDTSYQAQRVYIDPLHAVWKITSSGAEYDIDAKTGETLPPQSAVAQPSAGTASSGSALTQLAPEHTVTASLQLPVFDPYERLPWVKGKAIHQTSFGDVEAELKRRTELTFVALLYAGKVTVPLAVTGYHQWSNGEQFLLLEHDGQRAIPYDTASKLGKLYP